VVPKVVAPTKAKPRGLLAAAPDTDVRPGVRILNVKGRRLAEVRFLALFAAPEAARAPPSPAQQQQQLATVSGALAASGAKATSMSTGETFDLLVLHFTSAFDAGAHTNPSFLLAVCKAVAATIKDLTGYPTAKLGLQCGKGLLPLASIKAASDGGIDALLRIVLPPARQQELQGAIQQALTTKNGRKQLRNHLGDSANKLVAKLSSAYYVEDEATTGGLSPGATAALLTGVCVLVLAGVLAVVKYKRQQQSKQLSDDELFKVVNQQRPA
jgi:hypothetical protein